MDRISMRLASRQQDLWELRDAESVHAAHPDTFWIPRREAREHLRPGLGVRLAFDIVGVEEDGSIGVQGERMWVLVTERVGDTYIGILENEPASLDPSDEDIYLRRGAEIPFRAEHVLDIEEPPPGYVAERLAEPPTRRWPRE